MRVSPGKGVDILNMISTPCFFRPINSVVDSGHIGPVNTYPDIYANQAGQKTCQVSGHHAERFSKPPADPAEECDAEQNYQFFHSR
jgi:hypothetical protein